jgi:hypothetical protein
VILIHNDRLNKISFTAQYTNSVRRKFKISPEAYCQIVCWRWNNYPGNLPDACGLVSSAAFAIVEQ